MIGIVYLKSNNQIISIVPDVQSHSDTDIIGKDASVKGIDLTQASFCLVDYTTQEIGDTLGSFADVRSQLIPSLQEQLKNLQQAFNEFILGG